MATPALHAKRSLWRSKEKFRYKKWYEYGFKKAGLSEVARAAERKRWWVLYSEAHHIRQAIDRELAQDAKHERAHAVSNYGTNFIKHFEGFSATIYHDSVGVPTVGYGHTENVRAGAIWVHGQRTPGRLTEAEATTLLHNDLNAHYAPYVNALSLPLNQHQFDALTSFVYNVGLGGITTHTHVGQYLRDENWRAAANALLEWDRAGGNVLQGLLIRREAERHLFLL
jgi:lysozyme